MKKLFVTVLLLIVFPVLAKHIVGGEFELLYVSGSTYRLNLVMYIDQNINPQVPPDPTITVGIFSKTTNRLIQQVVMVSTPETAVQYTQAACANGELKTAREFYSTTIQLSATIYTEPGGYYVSWERCCRNYTITNIYSNDPALSNQWAGQTFYLEFPPVVKNGKPFINSSPRLFPPLNDYACPNRFYYVNFGGVDDDGDSLVYSLITPLSTHFDSAVVYENHPAPYPFVNYHAPFNQHNIIGGHPDLNITPSGFLSCTPGGLLGLYVFSVRVQQFRDKVQIGESRRDFQMLVTDACPADDPPQITSAGATSDGTNSYLSLSYSNSITDDNRCVHVFVGDPDSDNNGTENVNIRAIPIGFVNAEVIDVLPSITQAALVNGAQKEFIICFPQCPFTSTGKYKIGIVAYDDACALPRTDTLFIDVTQQLPPNADPVFITPVTKSFSTTIDESQSVTVPFEITDADLDSLQLFIATDSFNLASAGMTVNVLTNTKGIISGNITWNAYCDIYNFTKRTSFKVTLSTNDLDLCELNKHPAASFSFTVRLPAVSPVYVNTSINGNSQPGPASSAHDSITGYVYSDINFAVNAYQPDGHTIKLAMKEEAYIPAADGIVFTSTPSANGIITGTFDWNVKCVIVNLGAAARDILFIATDSSNKCHIVKRDTVSVHIKALPPQNDTPVITLKQGADAGVSDKTLTVKPNDLISLTVVGQSHNAGNTDPNDIVISLLSATGKVPPKGYVFAGIVATTHGESAFEWRPDCSIFQNNVYSNSYEFRFLVTDKVCNIVTSDTATLNVTVADVEQRSTPFNPSNVVTPNGDFCNEYLAMEGLDDDAGAITNCERKPGRDAVISLPYDNCQGTFKFIKIVNRWGEQVYQSADRKFRWYPTSNQAGVYFYVVDFGTRQYKGTVTVAP